MLERLPGRERALDWLKRALLSCPRRCWLDHRDLQARGLRAECDCYCLSLFTLGPWAPVCVFCEPRKVMMPGQPGTRITSLMRRKCVSPSMRPGSVAHLKTPQTHRIRRSGGPALCGLTCPYTLRGYRLIPAPRCRLEWYEHWARP